RRRDLRGAPLHWKGRNVDSDIQALIDNTGMTMPLAGRIVKLLVDSGASRLEILAALDVVGKVIHVLPVPLVSEGAASPDLFPRTEG
ncbi:MAG: hypothetical protein ACRD9L_10820, partial [Bryobacteraceae bacterium]